MTSIANYISFRPSQSGYWQVHPFLPSRSLLPTSAFLAFCCGLIFAFLRLTDSRSPLATIKFGIWQKFIGFSWILRNWDWFVGNRAGLLLLGLPERPLIPVVVMGKQIRLWVGKDWILRREFVHLGRWLMLCLLPSLSWVLVPFFLCYNTRSFSLTF